MESPSSLGALGILPREVRDEIYRNVSVVIVLSLQALTDV